MNFVITGMALNRIAEGTIGEHPITEVRLGQCEPYTASVWDTEMKGRIVHREPFELEPYSSGTFVLQIPDNLSFNEIGLFTADGDLHVIGCPQVIHAHRNVAMHININGLYPTVPQLHDYCVPKEVDPPKESTFGGAAHAQKCIMDITRNLLLVR